ncbi:MAG: hypothetical protein V1748_12590 [Actinomycetota bacterium]
MAKVRSGARKAGRRGFTVGEMIFLVGVLAVFVAGTVVVVGDGVDRYGPGSGDTGSGEAHELMDRLDMIVEQARAFYLTLPAGLPGGVPGRGEDYLAFDGDLDGDGTWEAVVLRAVDGGRVLAADISLDGEWQRVELTDGLDPGAAEPFAASLEAGKKVHASPIDTLSAGDEVTAVRYTVKLVGEKGPRTYSGTASFERPVPVERWAP